MKRRTTQDRTGRILCLFIALITALAAFAATPALAAGGTMDIEWDTDISLAIDQSGTGWSWDADSNTLTLDAGYGGANIAFRSSSAINLVYSGNVTIGEYELGGSAITCSGTLNISGGGGTLTATTGIVSETGDINIGGNANVTASSPSGIGIEADGEVNISTTGDVIVNGNVTGDVIVSNGTVTIDGDIDGNLDVTGGEVTVTGDVVGDVIVSGGTVVTGNVGGDVIVTDGTVEVGDVTGDVTVSGGTVVTGDVGGDVTVSDGTVEVGDVTGNTHHTGGTINEALPPTWNFSVSNNPTATYETLAEAVAAVSEGGTITMLQDVTVGDVGDVDEVTLDEAKTYTIDLGDNTLEGDGANAIIVYSGTVTVKNGTVANKIYVSDGELIIESGTYSGGEGAIFCYDGKVTIVSGTFSNTGSDGCLLDTEGSGEIFIATGSTVSPPTDWKNADEHNVAVTAAAATSAPTITTATPLPNGTVGAAYSRTLEATGDGTMTWSVSAGSLPAGLSLHPLTGVISGTPTAAGTASFTVKAANGTSPDATQALSITINTSSGGTPSPIGRAPTITTTALASGAVSIAYSQTLAATGTTPITWSVTVGGLPAGLTLSSAGVISGTPTAVGTADFTVKATNSEGSDTKTFTIVINAAPVVDDSSPLPPHIITPPGSENNPVANPDGSWTLPGGGTVTIPGEAGNTTVTVPGGTIVAPDGSVTIPSDGTARVTTPDGTIADISGGSVITWPCGAIIVGPGGGRATYRDGTTEEIPPDAELTVDPYGGLIISIIPAAQNHGGCNAGAGILSLLLAAAFATMRRRALI